MKKLLFLVLFFASFGCQYQTQNALVMCHDPKATFAAFGDDVKFRNAHPTPAPFTGVLTGNMIKFAVPAGDSARAYLVRADQPTDKYLLLFHEYWGLNDYIKKEADMWSAKLNVNVIALDLYDGQVASKSEEAVKLMQGNNPKRSEAIIAAVPGYTGNKADFRTMGWCFGGGWSLKAALVLKEKVKACVMFYGMPEKDQAVLKTLSTDVLFIHPLKDQWITSDVTKEFEDNMLAAGKKVEVHHYDADHAFANPSSPRYNESAAKESRMVVENYLQGK
jgi:carboxymethylenebutenolidase